MYKTTHKTMYKTMHNSLSYPMQLHRAPYPKSKFLAVLSIAASVCLLPSLLNASEPPHVKLSGEVGNAADISAARFRFAPFPATSKLRMPPAGLVIFTFRFFRVSTTRPALMNTRVPEPTQRAT